MNYTLDLKTKAKSYLPKGSTVEDVTIVPVKKSGQGNHASRMIILYFYKGELLRTNVAYKGGKKI
jgi:hypothetical protein